MAEPPPPTPLLNNNYINLELPPVAIILIGTAGYLLFFFVLYLIRYCIKTKGGYQNDIFDCQCSGGGCCQCLENCADLCKCGTPTIGKCLDVCCPRRDLDFVGLILCQCCQCGSTENSCCMCCGEGPCCSYGDLNINCACIQPDLDSGVNCLCCQMGGPNYNRAGDE